jgi:hypothetical protein
VKKVLWYFQWIGALKFLVTPDTITFTKYCLYFTMPCLKTGVWEPTNRADIFHPRCSSHVHLGRITSGMLSSRALHRVPIPMGGHGWASVLCIPTSSSKSESNFSDAGNTLTKKRSRLEPTTVNDLWFVRFNQDLVYAGNTHYTMFEYMGAIWIAWVGMGGYRSLLMVMVWVWVQIQRKMLGSA